MQMLELFILHLHNIKTNKQKHIYHLINLGRHIRAFEYSLFSETGFRRGINIKNYVYRV